MTHSEKVRCNVRDGNGNMHRGRDRDRDRDMYRDREYEQTQRPRNPYNHVSELNKHILHISGSRELSRDRDGPDRQPLAVRGEHRNEDRVRNGWDSVNERNTSRV